MRTLFPLLCCILLAIAATGSGNETAVHSGFAAGLCSGQFGRGDAARLSVDSMATPELWNVVYRTPPGVFRGGKSYLVRFRYVIDHKNHAEAGLVFLVRPADVQHGNADLYIAVGDREEITEVVFEVDVPESAEDYAFAIHTRHGVAATVDHFSIAEKQPRFTVFQASPEAVPVAVDRAQLPLGSQEFTVDLPAPAADAPVLSGRDFGLSPDSPDNSEAFRRALAACREQRAASLVLEPGVYRFANTEPLRLDGLNDFTLEGGGATLQFSQLVGNPSGMRQGGEAHLEVTGCRRLLLRDLNIDWDWEAAPLASFVKLVGRGTNAGSVDLENNWLEFEFVDYRDFPADRVRIADIEAVDPETMSVGRSERHHSALFQFIENHPAWGSAGRLEWTAPNRVRVYQSRDSGDQNWFFQAAEVGMLYRMRHFAYDTTALLFNGGNAHITLEDIDIFSCPGMGVLLLNDQQYMDFNRFNTTIPAGSRRPISCTSDNVHSSMSSGFLRFRDCDFGWGGDDLMNLGDSNGCASVVDTHTLKVENYAVSYLEPGDRFELRSSNFAPLGLEFTVAGVDAADNLLRTEEVLPADFGPGERLVLFPRKYDTRNVIVRDCRFHDNRGHGIVASVRDVTIEDNEFVHTAFGGIMLSTGYSLGYWGEGLGVSNAVIRGNTFDRVNPTAADAADKFAMDIAIFLYAIPEPGEPLHPLMNRILLENNRFIDPSGAVLYAENADAVSFIGNTVRVDTPRTVEFPHRGSVVLENVGNARVENNLWIDSPAVQAKVWLTPAQAPTARVGGNRLEKAAGL